MADPKQAARRECDALGAFVDRYLGTAFKLGGCGLHWGTVATASGGWQVYASDRDWLVTVSEALARQPRADEAQDPATGVGFCDGRRAAALVRGWMPLVVDGGIGAERIARGLRALATTIEGLGKIRFRYRTPAPDRLEAVIEIEPSLRDAGSPTTTRPTVLPGPGNAPQKSGTSP